MKRSRIAPSVGGIIVKRITVPWITYLLAAFGSAFFVRIVSNCLRVRDLYSSRRDFGEAWISMAPNPLMLKLGSVRSLRKLLTVLRIVALPTGALVGFLIGMPTWLPLLILISWVAEILLVFQPPTVLLLGTSGSMAKDLAFRLAVVTRGLRAVHMLKGSDFFDDSLRAGKSWQQSITSVASVIPIIVFDLRSGVTPHVEWELDHLLTRERARKTIILLDNPQVALHVVSKYPLARRPRLVSSQQELESRVAFASESRKALELLYKGSPIEHHDDE